MLLIAQGFRIEAFIGSGFRVYGFAFRLQSLGCRIEAFIWGFPILGVPFLHSKDWGVYIGVPLFGETTM